MADQEPTQSQDSEQLKPDITKPLLDSLEAMRNAQSPEFQEKHKAELALANRAEQMGLETLAQRIHAHIGDGTEFPRQIPDQEGLRGRALAEKYSELCSLVDPSRFEVNTFVGEEPTPNHIVLLESDDSDSQHDIESIVRDLAQLLGIPSEVSLSFKAVTENDGIEQNGAVFRGYGIVIRDLEVARVPLRIEGSPFIDQTVFEVVRGVGESGKKLYQVTVREEPLTDQSSGTPPSAS